ncbi:hypothetical protein GGP41_006663 [Bipolaris sorokiniana]|uniref:Secreted protein n=1 Tax=Cochliobolus sativus TaxID=45130 RepID=A0A8H6DZN3_COCSA|nr:hypothetical protein GGP41_006663 [Bipolaris sorokiniana]
MCLKLSPAILLLHVGFVAVLLLAVLSLAESCGRIESKIVSGSMEGVRHCQRLGVERITDRCCLHGLERQRPAKPSVGYSVVRNVNLGRNHGAGYSARKSCTSSYWSNMPKTRQ